MYIRTSHSALDAHATPSNTTDIFNENKSRYEGMGLRDLAHEMFDTLKEHDRSTLLAKAFGTLPTVCSQGLMHVMGVPSFVMCRC